MSWALMVHGGAKEIAPPEHEAHRRGCLRAVDAGRKVLEAGGPAVEAVAAAIRVLEDDPTFNAGYGSVLNAEGAVEMDAALMDGATLDVGGVAAVQGVRNPIEVAQLMLRDRPTLLAGPGARAYGEARGAALCAPADLIASPRRELAAADARDTVGCVALDTAGNLAAGTSTGGLTGKLAGRVGDSPLPGCGFYAENGVGASAFSGEGETLSRTLMAGRTQQLMTDLGPQRALEQALARIVPLGGDGGGIAIEASGLIGWAHNSPQFAVGYATSDLSPRAYVEKSEEQQDS
jgi:beta-aspartyl-peptidase (threonine type)